MATYYYDSVNGNDANNGTSTSTPKQLYTSVGTVAGDRFLFKRGTTQQYPGLVTARSGTSDNFRSYFGVYGEAQVPYAIFRQSSGAIIFNGAGSKYITFEDMYFDMRDSGVLHSVYCASQGANQTIGNIFRRCYFTGSNNGAVAAGGGNGLGISREGAATASGPQDYLVEDCQFWGNSGHGLLIAGGVNVIVRRCKFWGNGFNDSSGGHGFSSRALHTTAPSGWTNTAGTVWQRTLVAPQTDAYYVRTSVGAYPRLTRTTGTATSPGVGEYGISGGVLYINVNSASNPSTQSVTYVYALCSNLTIEDCESYGNFSDSRTAGTEGHGFAFDDYADNSIFRRNLSYSNQGYGFSINRGDSNRVESNVATGNGGAAVWCNITDAPRVVNNTFLNNNQGTVHALTSELYFGFGASNGVATNNIIAATNTYGINNDPANVGFSGKNNCIYGFTTADRTAFVTATVTDSPALDSLYRPVTSSVKTGGTYLGGIDFYGKEFPVTTPQGAAVTFSSRSNTNRSIAASRTVTARLVARRAKAG